MSDDRKRSRWITDRQPACPGVYERDFAEVDEPESPLYCYWSGKLWFFGAFTPEDALMEWRSNEKSPNQSLPWRGLAEKPSNG